MKLSEMTTEKAAELIVRLCPLVEELIDDELVKDTKSFQEAHGLEVDGIVGKNSWTEGFKQI